MTLFRLLSPCVFGHPSDPITVVQGSVMHYECRRCQQDLGEVLAGQKFKARKPAKGKKKRSAEVLTMAERKRA